MTSSRFTLCGIASVGLIVLLFSTACPPPPSMMRHGPRPAVRVRATPPRVVAAPAPRPTVVATQPAVITAPALAPGGAAANGAVSYGGQRVRYPISITYPRTVSIYVQGHGLDPTVAIYDSFGNRLAYNDDGGSGLDSALSHTLAPGSYIVEVSGFSGSTGPYTLTVN